MPDTPEETRKVYLVDDDVALHDAMKWLLESESYQVECFASGEEFFDKVPVDAAGCLLLDILMPGLSGLEVRIRMRELGYTLPTIIVSAQGYVEAAVQAMHLGCLTYVEKPIKDEVLLNWIDKAFEAEADLAELRATRRSIFANYCKLTERERAVFWLVVQGRPNKQIADDLNRAEKTVEFHRGNLMRKLEVFNLADLVRYSLEIDEMLRERGLTREDEPQPDSGGRQAEG